MKGLFIGINYIGQSCELRGCINDVKNMKNLYNKLYGLTTCKMLIDNNEGDGMPTKANILNGIKWLVSNTTSGEQLFFYYSGHGTYISDVNRDESDKNDECIVPCDYQSSKFITDDVLRQELILKCRTCYLFSVFDSCHSGTMLDLNYSCTPTGTIKKISQNFEVNTKVHAICLSGCRDDQTSADTTETINGSRTSCGALSWALFYALNVDKKISSRSLLNHVSDMLSKSKYSQKPQLSFDSFPRLDESVIKL